MKRLSTFQEPQARSIKMTSVEFGSKSLLQKVHDLLDRQPDSYDVTFCVGPEKKEVKAVKILLKAVSPVFEREFRIKREGLFWESGIPLPDFNAEAFQLFVELTIHDIWNAESLKSLNLLPEQVVNLIEICRHYEMKSELMHLQDLKKEFYSSGFDVSQLPVRTKASDLQMQSKGEELIVVPTSEYRTLNFTLDDPIVDRPVFICDGKPNLVDFRTKQKILVHGLGFLGPVYVDAYYNVTVRFVNECREESFEPETIEKRVFAQKGKIFRIAFDHPVALTEGSLKMRTNLYAIWYSLNGPDTKSFQRILDTHFITRDEDNEFQVMWYNNQLAEILYTKM